MNEGNNGERVSRVPEPAPVPVFVHSSFRTSSTWLWSKLRCSPAAIAYCEIFHELLANLTVGDQRSNDFGGWNSKHPEAAPYFLEFIRLTGSRGAIRGFDKNMSYGWFIPEGGFAGELSHGERAYVEGLIQAARERRKIPVLTDTRTLGRFTALAEAFPGHHVLLVRNAFHQWGSYSEQWAQGNDAFIGALFMAIDGSRHDPFVKLLMEWFADEDRSARSAATFQLFLLFHLYLYAHAFDAANLVVDVNRIAADPDHRTMVEQRLSTFVQCPLDLSDVRPSFGLSLFRVDAKTAFVDTINQFAKQAIDDSISESAAQFANRIKDEALLEWETHEFYQQTSRTFAYRRLTSLERDPDPRQGVPRLSTEFELALDQYRLTPSRDEGPLALAPRPLGQPLSIEGASHSPPQLPEQERRLPDDRRPDVMSFRGERDHQLDELERKVYDLTQRLSVVGSQAQYLSDRSFIGSIFFRKNGKPVYLLRHLLFGPSRQPRRWSRWLILRKNGEPRSIFSYWLTH